MSALSLLTAANAGRLTTGDDANPWGSAYVRGLLATAEADITVVVAFWEVGVLELGVPTESGWRHWFLTSIGSLAFVDMGRRERAGGPGPHGDVPPMGGPYR